MEKNIFLKHKVEGLNDTWFQDLKKKHCSNQDSMMIGKITRTMAHYK